MKLLHRLTCASLLLLACAAWAQQPAQSGAMKMPMPVTPAADNAAATPAEGEVIKVDQQHKTVTLKHGEIKNLHMPPMTMDFHVSNEALLAQLKHGSKIRFTAGRVNGAYTVLSVEPAPR